MQLKQGQFKEFVKTFNRHFEAHVSGEKVVKTVAAFVYSDKSCEELMR